MTHIETQRARLAQVGGEMAAITASAEAEGRALTAEENAQFNAKNEEFKSIENSIASIERAEEIQQKLAAAQPRLVQSQPTVSATPTPVQGSPSITGGGQVAHNFQNHGFKMGFGEFLMSVRSAKTTGRVDPRLMVNAITTFGGESVGTDGGYLVPPQFTQGIMSQVVAQDSFLSALNPIPTNSNLLTVPVDQDPPWGTTGITAAKTAENAAITQTKPVVGKTNVVMHNIKSFVAVSNESLRDISFLASYVQRKMAEKLRWKAENYVINGTGVDEPLGILNAGSLLALSSDIDSSTTTLGARDVMAMKAACLPGRKLWIINPTVAPQIWALKSDATTGYPLYTTDMRLAPGGALLGAPVYESEACKAYNTAGDILCVCAEGYLLAFEAGGVQQATSLEFAFDQDDTCFRATLRMGGNAAYSSTVLRADGANSASHLVALAQRS